MIIIILLWYTPKRAVEVSSSRAAALGILALITCHQAAFPVGFLIKMAAFRDYVPAQHLLMEV